MLGDLAEATDRPYAVNIPLYRPGAAEILDAMHDRRVPVVIASQGSPKAHLARFRDIGATWIQVVATLEHARKAAAAGVDALVVVGTEAEWPSPAEAKSPPWSRCGVSCRRLPFPSSRAGVADGWGIAALLALGADAVQLGTRFLLTEEATVHANYKAAVLAA